MDSFTEHYSDTTPPASSEASLEWRGRYEGLVSVAYIGTKAVAGISGPWSGKFALTWWERPLPARQLELFDTMRDAQREVEQWAMRMRNGGYSPNASEAGTEASIIAFPGRMETVRQAEAPKAPTGLFDRMRSLLPSCSRSRSQAASSEAIDRLRRSQVCRETDTGDLHFAANE